MRSCRASYEQLSMIVTDKRRIEQILEADQFKRMRRSLTIIENEMDEVIEDPGMTDYDRKREWHT